MKGALDWIGRTAVLVLSVVATLTMMSSLASISGGPIGGMMLRSGDMVPAGPVTDAAPPPAIGNESEVADDGAVADAGRHDGATAAPPPNDAETIRWLKALTYAVQALAIVAAVGVIVLLRLTAILSRIVNR